MPDTLLLIALLFFTVAPVFIGMGVWIYGRVKNKKKLRHNGFIMMMLSLLIIFLLIFTVGAVFFYMYLINR
ncbi:MAG: hypothetical protein PHN99_00200 [Eubacteriales bacterium]|nr:hypothetical protein [Eubacteriales bacterium]MDD4326755.1 hypothetical protein [Eubacteriales bacterium]MDD4716513.1 hypothetical protein [Eubacteriales bacterium]